MNPEAENNPNPKPPFENLKGVVERLTFQNEENGYTVARLKPTGKSQEITITGSLPGVTPGELLSLRGRWVSHPKFGRQFEVNSYSVQLPGTITGIRKYLGSGLISGVGPVTAERIVDHFGLKTLEIIEESPNKLREVSGIGQYRAGKILEAWEEQKHIKEIMIFLQSHAVSAGLAVKIYRQYGDAAVSVIQTNPYQLAGDIYGVGFKTADKIARHLGLPIDSPTRIQAGILYTLSDLTNDGHCFATPPQLISKAGQILEMDEPTCQVQLEALLAGSELVDDGEAIYLPPFLYAETGVANKLRLLLSSRQDRLIKFQDLDWDTAFASLDPDSEITLTEQQIMAIRMSLTSKVSILTGGPGTGKSTITRNIIQLAHHNDCSVILAAPTGRAAKRLQETAGIQAKTIHRLLEFSPSAGNQFMRDRDNPLNADLIIIDETSMVDILLMNHLLNAIGAGSHLLLVGDVDQLPSVGPGNVLKDLINSQRFPVTRLQTIFRQSHDSHIILNAHRINQGDMPLFEKNTRDFFLFSEEDAQKAADWVEDLVTSRIQDRFNFNPQTDIQVLSPMHRGAAGVGELNTRLQAALNPPTPGKIQFKHGPRSFREGDRVMQTRNDYERKVFNGDMGKITHIDLEDQVATVEIDGRPVPCRFSQFDELIHAYAISIHKSQGSEFPVVVVPLLTQHYMMLQRNLLYTAVTRARQMVVLVGSKRAIGMAVSNNRIAHRNTKLAERVAEQGPVDDTGYTSSGQAFLPL
jgi:exodeoxyribonuclease V alpha subunit